jgi:hypothetical protein
MIHGWVLIYTSLVFVESGHGRGFHEPTGRVIVGPCIAGESDEDHPSYLIVRN